VPLHNNEPNQIFYPANLALIPPGTYEPLVVSGMALDKIVPMHLNSPNLHMGTSEPL